MAWPGALALVLESICEGLFVGSYKIGKILSIGQEQRSVFAKREENKREARTFMKT
jgi:hypothetical protein